MRMIDADALLNNIRRAMYPSEMTTTIAVGICESHVKDMPTVDAAPVVHGSWIKGGYACGENEYKCSVCGETEWRTSSARMKYCMFCGAKMDGGDANDK